MNEKNTINDENKLFTEYRPWGYFTILEETKSYKVKKLVINPNQKLSLQYHNYRDEQWIVAQGEPTLTCEKETKDFTIGENIQIARKKIHRIENKKESIAIIIEVQTGDYLGEDDIVRLEDIYSRADKNKKP